jgi:hypothetical protein
MNPKVTRSFIIGTFVTLYVLVSSISTIHVIDFFKLSNPDWLAISLALAFEVGAAASLASLVTLEKMNKWMVWALFIILTLMQAMGNTYYTYVHLHDYQGWIELFGLNEEDPLYQKRVLASISGAILPIVALGFIKSLVDYIKPTPIEVGEGAPSDESIVQAQTSQTIEDVIDAGQKAQIKKAMTKAVEQAKTRENAGETYDDEPTALANSKYAEQLIEFGKNPIQSKVDNIKPAISSDEALARGRRL